MGFLQNLRYLQGWNSLAFTVMEFLQNLHDFLAFTRMEFLQNLIWHLQWWNSSKIFMISWHLQEWNSSKIPSIYSDGIPPKSLASTCSDGILKKFSRFHSIYRGGNLPKSSCFLGISSSHNIRNVAFLFHFFVISCTGNLPDFQVGRRVWETRQTGCLLSKNLLVEHFRLYSFKY